MEFQLTMWSVCMIVKILICAKRIVLYPTVIMGLILLLPLLLLLLLAVTLSRITVFGGLEKDSLCLQSLVAGDFLVVLL